MRLTYLALVFRHIGFSISSLRLWSLGQLGRCRSEGNLWLMQRCRREDEEKERCFLDEVLSLEAKSIWWGEIPPRSA